MNGGFLTNERSAGPVNKVNLDADWRLSFFPQKTRDTLINQINENVKKIRSIRLHVQFDIWWGREWVVSNRSSSLLSK